MKEIYALTSKQIEQLHHLYQNQWWTQDRSLEETIKGVEGSQVCIGLVDKNDTLKGFARVITDFTFKALIFDITIAEECRNSGLGNHLMSLIKNNKQLIEVKHFELYCLPELEEFYKQYGFSDDIGDIKLLRYINA